MKNEVSDTKLNELLAQAEKDGIQKLVVGAVIVDDGKVLFLERKADDFMGGLVELPSGTIDEGEDLLTSLAREVKEETGLEVVSVDGFISTFDYRSASGKKTRQFNFKVTTAGSVHLDGEEHIARHWVAPDSDEYSKLNISDAVREVSTKISDAL